MKRINAAPVWVPPPQPQVAALYLVSPFDTRRTPTRHAARLHALAAFAFFGIGALSAALALPSFVKSRQAEKWPLAPGLVESSRVVVTTEAEERDRCTSLAIEYRYEVGGRILRGTQWCVGDGCRPSMATSFVSERYPAGAAVNVRYNPQDPSEALLETGVRGSPWIFVIVATSGISLAGLWLAEALRLGRAAPRISA